MSQSEAMLAAQIILDLVATYAGIGLLFALWFICHGVKRFDPAVSESSWGFRLLILPGSAALWPILLPRALRAWRRGPHA